MWAQNITKPGHSSGKTQAAQLTATLKALQPVSIDLNLIKVLLNYMYIFVNM